jgi:hypothetical protein
MFSSQCIAEAFYACESFILLPGKRIKHFLQVTSACKADILAAANIQSFIAQLALTFSIPIRSYLVLKTRPKQPSGQGILKGEVSLYG